MTTLQLTTAVKKAVRIPGLTRSITESMLFRFTGLLLVFLLHVLLAQFMGPKGFGDYTIITSLLEVLLTVSLFGMDSAAQRFLPGAVARKEFAAANGFIRFSYRWILFISLLCSTGVLVYLIFNGKKSTVSFSEGIFWTLFLLPVLAFVYQAGAILRSFSRIKASMLPIYVILPVLLSFTASFYFMQNNRLPVDAVMLLQMGCTLLVGWMVSRTTRNRIKSRMETDQREFRRRLWLGAATVFFISAVLEALLRQSDILMVGYLISHIKAGQYAAAARITSLVAFGLSVTDYVYMPKIAAIHESGKKKLLKQTVRSSSRQILLVTIPIVFLLIVTGPWLLSAFGPAFSNAYVPMLILLFGQLVSASMGLAGGIMSMLGDRKTYLMISLLAVVVQVLLLFLLLPRWGLIGAALSGASGRIVLNVFSYYRLYLKTGISASPF